MKRLHEERGFTLVELAIVLVIIGIILGTVLKGQELINNARIKRAYNQYREILAAVYTYYDRYNYYPGDDPKASSRWTDVTDGNGNGLIGGLTLTCSSGATSETCQVWLHLRKANIISGNDTYNPTNIYGGGIGVGYATVQGVSGHWIGMDNLPREVACSLDEKYDDGSYNSGSIMTTSTIDYCTTTSGTTDLYFKL